MDWVLLFKLMGREHQMLSIGRMSCALKEKKCMSG